MLLSSTLFGWLLFSWAYCCQTAGHVQLHVDFWNGNGWLELRCLEGRPCPQNKGILQSHLALLQTVNLADLGFFVTQQMLACPVLCIAQNVFDLSLIN